MLLDDETLGRNRALRPDYKDVGLMNDVIQKLSLPG